MNSINHLILSSRNDYSTDMICIEMESRGMKYLRLNRDSFGLYRISLNINEETLTVMANDNKYYIDSNTLKSVYFRAPVFIRTHKHYSIEEQLYRSQWNAFMRNLIVFENATWVNNPVATYKAENKVFQLKKAREVGFDIPNTYVGNTIEQLKLDKKYAIKALDTPLFYEGETESFTYTTLVDSGELETSNLADAPTIVQDAIENKTDIRATVIGDSVFAVKILKNGRGISGDWRVTKKEELQYQRIRLPQAINDSILTIMKSLNLVFGGIDLMEHEGTYFFVEVNPTGEWGWLVKNARIPVDKEIVNILES